MKHPCIQMERISFGYTAQDVVRELSLNIQEGELCVITGNNGSGKSTLLKLLLGELTPRQGSIRLMNRPLQDIRDFRFLGYMPQVNNVNQVAFPITGVEMVVQNLYRDFGWLKVPRRTHRKRAAAFLEQMGLGEYKHYRFKDLSGGLQQRVMICRALINQPRLLILDEPTAGVDEGSKKEFLKIVSHMNHERGITIVLVTHELGLMQDHLRINTLYDMREGALHRVAV